MEFGSFTYLNLVYASVSRECHKMRFIVFRQRQEEQLGQNDGLSSPSRARAHDMMAVEEQKSKGVGQAD